jgi:pimeloyl-ACP methyl ester carboxylesterase
MLSRRDALIATAAAAAAPPAMAAGAEFVFRKQYVDCRYGQLHMHVARPADPKAASRPPIVCLHPTPASGRYFLDFMRDLGRDRIAMGVDTAGYGESDRPPQPVAIDGYSGALGDALKNLGYGKDKPVDLLGYHTGNFIGIDLAVRQPELVRRLVLVAVPHYPDPAQRRAAAERIDRWTFSEDPKPVLELWEGTVVKRAKGVTLQQSIEQWQERIRPGDKEWWAYDAVFSYDSSAMLPRITQPAVLLNPHGPLHDQTMAAAKLMPKARLVDLPELTHGVFQVGTPVVAREARAFLDVA